MDKISALANYLGINEDEIKSSGYDDNVFELEDGSEYLVLTDDEADTYVVDEIESLFDDLGLDSFTPNFQNWILDNACSDAGWFEDAIREMEEFYAQDIEGEPADSDEYENRLEEEMAEAGVDTFDEFVEYLVDNVAPNGDFVKAFRNEFGDTEFREVSKNNLNFDMQAIADEAVSLDGRGHFLSGYDGEELELGDSLYGYRIN